MVTEARGSASASWLQCSQSRHHGCHVHGATCTLTNRKKCGHWTCHACRNHYTTKPQGMTVVVSPFSPDCTWYSCLPVSPTARYLLTMFRRFMRRTYLCLMAPNDGVDEGSTSTTELESTLSDDGELWVSTLIRVLLACFTRSLLSLCTFLQFLSVSLFSRSSDRLIGFLDFI